MVFLSPFINLNFSATKEAQEHFFKKRDSRELDCLHNNAFEFMVSIFLQISTALFVHVDFHTERNTKTFFFLLLLPHIRNEKKYVRHY